MEKGRKDRHLTEHWLGNVQCDTEGELTQDPSSELTELYQNFKSSFAKSSVKLCAM